MTSLKQKIGKSNSLPKLDIIQDYKTAFLSRVVSFVGRKEVLSGKAKFGIFGDGKEVAQVAMARAFRPGDWRSGYYRDQTFMFSIGAISVKEYFSQLYADADLTREPSSQGRQMNAHFASRFLESDGAWKDQVNALNSIADSSPTASQMPRLLGLGYASKLYRYHKGLDKNQRFSKNGDEIAFGTIGNASTSEGIFWETLNAAGVLSVPLLVSVWDDEFGISVPNSLQTIKSSISRACIGFQMENGTNGLDIYQVKGWDYPTLVDIYRKATARIRKKHIPALIHVDEITQPQGHSTSGSHERYKTKERLTFETEMDCLAIMKKWMIDSQVISASELQALEEEVEKTVRESQLEAWQNYLGPMDLERQELLQVFSNLSSKHGQNIVSAEIGNLKSLTTINRRAILSMARQTLFRLKKEHPGSYESLENFIIDKKKIHTQRYCSDLLDNGLASCELQKNIQPEYSQKPENIDGRLIINRCFDFHLERDSRIFLLGEDIGKLGGVNLEFDGLHEKFGSLRVTDTGIREATIVGQAIGSAVRGLRPVADIQYLDYLIYALQVLSDDLCSLRYRSAGGQAAPVIVRTKGHRLEGIWHTGSPMGMILHSLRGMHVCVPRNMVQATGFYNSLFHGDDPALVVEVLNGYRLKEDVPANLNDIRIPLGLPEILAFGTDITIVSYGACVTLCQQACVVLNEAGISAEIIDVRTLLPFDKEHLIASSLKKTNALLIVDEDVPGGASGFILQQILEGQHGYDWLDAPPRTLTAKDNRSPYGSDGDYFTKPSKDDIVELVHEMIVERHPEQVPGLFSGF